MANTTSDISTVEDNTSMVSVGPEDAGTHTGLLPSFPPSPLSHFILKTVLCGVVLLVTFVGNALVLVSFRTTRKLRTYTNYYIVGLAVADLVSGGVTPALLNISWFIGYWPLGVAVCRVAVYVNIVFVHATFLLTFIICVDRYRAMRMPLKHLQEKNMRHALKMILPCFLLPGMLWAVMVLILPEYNVFRPLPRYTCHIPYASNRIVLLASSLFLSWIPIFGTSALYAVIYFRFIRKSPNFRMRRDSKFKERNSASLIETTDHGSCPAGPPPGKQDPDHTNHAFSPEEGGRAGRAASADGERDDDDSHEDETEHVAKQKPSGLSVRESLPNPQHQKRLTSSRRATRTLAYIIAVMIISGTPWFVYSVVKTIVPTIPYIPAVAWFVGYAVHFSSATNPFCYAICNPVFKKAFLRILCGQCGRRARKKT